jgi:hypothetical protein
MLSIIVRIPILSIQCIHIVHSKVTLFSFASLIQWQCAFALGYYLIVLTGLQLALARGDCELRHVGQAASDERTIDNLFTIPDNLRGQPPDS